MAIRWMYWFCIWINYDLILKTMNISDNNKPTKEEMLEVIQDKVWDKTLSKWCIVNDTDYWTGLAEIFSEDYSERAFIMLRINDLSKPYLERKKDVEDWEVIWHPVMLWDFLDYIDTHKLEDIYFEKQKPFVQEVKWYIPLISVISYCWQYKRKPISEQSDECIEYIYNLVK